MPEFHYESPIPVPVAALAAWHERPGAFQRLMPPWVRMTLVEQQGTVRDGDRLTFDLHQGPLRIRWEALHREFEPGRQFVDEQRRGPFAHWRHVHSFRSDGPEGSILDDRIEYELPGGRPAAAVLGGKVRRDLQRMFTWRHQRTARDLVRQQRTAHLPRMRIAIAGATGLVGTQLAAYLSTAGHEVHTLVRASGPPNPARPLDIPWNPARRELDPAALEGFDALIHLGGANIAGGRWTDARRREILASRVDSTRLLAETLARVERKPRVFVVASATGYYGSRGDEALTESSPAGQGFLPEVCTAWEQAADAARAAGVRTVHGRIGIVLSPRGGALPAMLRPFRMGVGGVIAGGAQYMSWIALDDLIGAFEFVLHDDRAAGPVNFTAPAPATNREFTRALGRVLRRPTVLPLPALAVRTLFGEMGQRLIVEGNRVQPNKLQHLGYRYACPDLERALRWELGL